MHELAVNRVNAGAGSGPPIGPIGMGVMPDKVYTDWQAGPLAITNNSLDASLAAGQFFTVQTPAGTRYTRAGNFQLDSTGTLTTPNGFAVLGTDSKPIKISGSTPPRIEPDGSLTVNGATVAQMQIVEAAKDGLTKDGETLFKATDARAIRPAAKPAVHAGTLEQSNVNVVAGMVKMITVSRAFEMAQRAIITQDDLLKHAANDLARV
jgi:flagellar basal body rod protein FlgG